MDISIYWYTKNVKGPVRLSLNTKDEEEFEILKKIVLGVTYLDSIRSALKLWFKTQVLIIAVIHMLYILFLTNFLVSALPPTEIHLFPTEFPNRRQPHRKVTL